MGLGSGNKKLLNEFAKGRKLTLCWTKAHVGVEGNEIADELAKDGAVNGLPVAVDQPKTEIL